MSETDEYEKLISKANGACYEFALICSELQTAIAPVSENALDVMMNTLMTELWDQGFSQEEIRLSFASALEDMNRYAAGLNRRN